MNKQISAIHGISLFSALASALSASHHWWNFWGLTWMPQFLILVVGVPVLAFLIFKILERIWDRISAISRTRWILFLIPAVVAAAIVAWRILSAPTVWHTLEVFPPVGGGQNEISLIEIKVSETHKVDFSKIDQLGSWKILDAGLVAMGSSQQSLVYSFLGPTDKPTQLIFSTSPQAPSVLVELDGKPTVVDLGGAQDGSRLVQLDPRYRFGIGAMTISALIFSLDFFAVLQLILFALAAQEILEMGQPKAPSRQPGFLSPHWKLIGILLVIAIAVHVVSLMAAPLVVVRDSAGYLAGALHWLQFHNLDGVPSERGPGIAMLFIPILGFFGRNAWGMKLLLHFLALACVPLGYVLGWQLSGRRWFAFLAGLIVVFTADMYLFSNMVMSDVPNIFFGLLFLVLLVQALNSFERPYVIASMLVGAFDVLLRPENIVMLGIGIGFLLVRGFGKVRSKSAKGPSPRQIWVSMGAVILVAVLPLLWWSAHNYRVYGFWGLSDHGGPAWFDGWVAFGEANRMPIADADSESVREIDEALSHYPQSPNDSEPFTSSDAISALVNSGYSRSQTALLLQHAAFDSILNDPPTSLELLFVKLRKGFVPGMQAPFAGSLSEQDPGLAELKTTYFDEENLNMGWLADLQRLEYQAMSFWYDGGGYQIWIWICLGSLGLSIFRGPFFLWAPVVLVTATRILLPTLVSQSQWRYVLAGIVPLQIIGLAGLVAAARFAIFLIPRQAPGNDHN